MTTSNRTDARQRSVRTVIQGGVAVALVAVAATVAELVTPGELIDWPVLAAAAGTAALTAVASYVHRLLSPPAEPPGG